MSTGRPEPSPRLVERVARLAGRRPLGWTRIERGYTAAGRWLVRFAGGGSAFAKVGITPQTAGWLRAEERVYSQIAGDFLPRVLGWDGGDEPILLLEDLSQAHWPPPWSSELVERVLDTLARVAGTPAPPGVPALEALRDDLAGWSLVAADPAPFLSLGLCSAAWLGRALPALLAAAGAAPLAGESLLHLDVRSDNLCFAGGRVVLVDWNSACRGDARMDVAGWLPSLHAEGGPAPEVILPDEPELAALLSSYFASSAGLPAPAPGSRVREVQRRQRGRSGCRRSIVQIADGGAAS